MVPAAAQGPFSIRPAALKLVLPARLSFKADIMKRTKKWWEFVRRQLHDDVCRGTYEPFASLPRSVVSNIIDKLSDEDLIRLALVSRSTRGQLLADASACQYQLFGYTNSASKFVSYLTKLKALMESEPEIKLADCVSEEGVDDSVNADSTAANVNQNHLRIAMKNAYGFFRMKDQCQTYFWFRPAYCELFNRHVLLVRFVRDFFAADDIPDDIKEYYDYVVELANQIDRGRNPDDWQWYRPIYPVDNLVATDLNSFLQHYC